jgi:ATP-dependent Clp protease adaptor protein ClpS
MPPITDKPEIEILEQEKIEIDEPWNVLIFNDPVNYMGFVTMVLRRVFGYSETKAAELMLQIHQQGKSVVWSGVRERAEFYVQQLHSYQLLASMKKAG